MQNQNSNLSTNTTNQVNCKKETHLLRKAPPAKICEVSENCLVALIMKYILGVLPEKKKTLNKFFHLLASVFFCLFQFVNDSELHFYLATPIQLAKNHYTLQKIGNTVLFTVY